jgi:acetoacetyl-CoA synthetase
LGFFGDADGQRFHGAYFSQNPGMWTHGDRISFSERGTARLHGRSDGVLNVRGIRIGTAEIYAALQDVPELLDVMAVEQELPDAPAGGRIVLLVVLRPGITLTSELVLRLRRQIAARTAAAYVPGAVLEVAALPTTHSGKRSEVAARDAINGRPVRNRAALSNPECLEAIAAHPRLRKPATVPTDSDLDEGTIAVLRAIWARAFGVESVGVHDDFFALGGDSLLALEICVGIREALGYELPITALFQANTVARLAEAIECGLAWQGDSPLLAVKQGTGRPVFILHAQSGNVFEWGPLLARLDCGRPVLALQARGLDPAAPPPPGSVQVLATDYLGLIRAEQPEGPYALVGYCFGGLLAYEIAVRLRRLGERVEFLGLIGTEVHVNTLPPLEWLRFRWNRLLYMCRQVAVLGAADTAVHARDKLRRMLRQRGLLKDALIDPFDARLPPGVRRVRLACEHAFMTYDPPHYSGVVTFFRAFERRPQFCNPLIVLRRRAALLRVVDVPGSHESMMQEPNVRLLAAALADSLRRAARPGKVEIRPEAGGQSCAPSGAAARMARSA